MNRLLLAIISYLRSSNTFFSAEIRWLFTLGVISSILVHHDLSYCLVLGSLSNGLGGITSLSYLDLSLNLLGGLIPSSIWDMPNFSHLSLSRNALSSLNTHSLILKSRCFCSSFGKYHLKCWSSNYVQHLTLSYF